MDRGGQASQDGILAFGHCSLYTQCVFVDGLTFSSVLCLQNVCFQLGFSITEDDEGSLELMETFTPSQSNIETFTIGEDAGYSSFEDCCTRCSALRPPPLPPTPPAPINPPPLPPGVPPPPPHPAPPPNTIAVQAASVSVVIPGTPRSAQQDCLEVC